MIHLEDYSDSKESVDLYYLKLTEEELSILRSTDHKNYLVYLRNIHKIESVIRNKFAIIINFKGSRKIYFLTKNNALESDEGYSEDAEINLLTEKEIESFIESMPYGYDRYRKNLKYISGIIRKGNSIKILFSNGEGEIIFIYRLKRSSIPQIIEDTYKLVAKIKE